ncbi:MAG: HesA/MoeB/ThiF family protein [Candidatus Firestonebacteria bacterium]|nr:HesA/MoeB/ThiF family protein [Candidatus Firestonebacteria bacterium]
MELTQEQRTRYSRNLLLPEVGDQGQAKLLASKVLVIGAGGLGSPVALYLAAAGVGTLGIADSDVVDLTNLQRQVIHGTPDLGKPKTESAQRKINLLNPGVRVVTYPTRFRAENALAMAADYDFVVDATDNFAAKFLINDACVLAGKPFSHGGVLGFEGQTMTVRPGVSACYRCVFRDLPPAGVVPTSAQVGILGAVAGILGTLMATEAIKFLLGEGSLLTDRLLILHAKTMQFREARFTKNQDCQVCGVNPTIIQLKNYE